MTPLPTESGSSSIPDLVSLVLAGGAFLVAVASLYLSNLKRAEIEVSLLPDYPPQVWSDSYTVHPGEGRWPTNTQLTVPLTAFNSGARTGVLTRVTLTRLEEVPPDPPLFIEYGQLPRAIEEPRDSFEPGTLRIYTVKIRLGVGIPVERLDELKRQVAAKREVQVYLTYRYLKGRSALPWRRHQAAVVDRTLDLRTSLAPYRQMIEYLGP